MTLDECYSVCLPNSVCYGISDTMACYSDRHSPVRNRLGVVPFIYLLIQNSVVDRETDQTVGWAYMALVQNDECTLPDQIPLAGYRCQES